MNANGADLSAGGAERYTADLARGMIERGHEVQLLAAAPPRAGGLDAIVLHRTDRRESVARRIANRAADLYAEPSSKLQRVLAEVSPDVVHTSTLPGITTAIWAASAQAGVPVVHTLHDYYLLCARASLTRRDGSPCPESRRFCRVRSGRLGRHSGFVSRLVGVSRFLLDIHRGFFPTAERHLVRLPVGLDVPSPRTLPTRPPATFGYLGRLEYDKGIDLLLAAVDQLADAGIRVRIAGTGRMQREVEAAAGDGMVDYAGVVSGRAKTDFIDSVDVGVLPSRWLEPGGPPYAPLEWLAAGRPMLVSARGGLTEFAADRHGAVHAFEPTAQALVEAALTLCESATFDKALESLARIDPDAERTSWLDAHEAIYRTLGTFTNAAAT